MKHLMFDIETFGLGETSAILQIAAIQFTRDNGIVHTASFNVGIIASTQPYASTEIDTVQWWLTKPEAYKSLLSLDFIGIAAALMRFNELVADSDFVWATARLDFNIINWHCRHWKYSEIPYHKEMNARTIRKLAKVDKCAPLIEHNAYYDCVAQIVTLDESLSVLNL